jgi:hypothetical protein
MWAALSARSQLKNNTGNGEHPAAVLVEEVLYVRRYGGVARSGNRAVVGRLGQLPAHRYPL